jgi:hypothetical protein
LILDQGVKPDGIATCPGLGEGTEPSLTVGSNEMTKTDQSPGKPKLWIKLKREYAGHGKGYRSTHVLAYIDDMVAA